VRKADYPTTLVCRLSRNPGALTSRTPQGHVGLFRGYFYLTTTTTTTTTTTIIIIIIITVAAAVVVELVLELELKLKYTMMQTAKDNIRYLQLPRGT
jgi:hypothetical protein